MKRVEFYRTGPAIVVQSGQIKLRWAGEHWDPTNWNGTEERFETLRAENPDVEFIEVPAPR